MRKRHIVLLLTAILGFLSIIASGGGGSGGGTTESDGIEPILDSPVAITLDNSDRVVAIALGDFFFYPEATAYAVSKTGKKTESMQALGIIRSHMQKADHIDLSASLCYQGKGSFDGDPTTGIGTYRYTDCVIDPSVGGVLNGSVTITGKGSFVGSTFEGQIHFDYYSEKTPAQKVTLNGRLNVAWDEVGDVETASISSDLIGQKVETSIYTETMNLTEFREDDRTDYGIEREGISVSFRLSSTRLNGIVDLRTVEQLEGFFWKEFPDKGQVIVQGAGNSRVRLTVDEGGTGEPFDTVTLETDADGDGSYEQSDILTWSELMDAASVP